MFAAPYPTPHLGCKSHRPPCLMSTHAVMTDGCDCGRVSVRMVPRKTAVQENEKNSVGKTGSVHGSETFALLAKKKAGESKQRVSIYPLPIDVHPLDICSHSLVKKV